jgi:hypothetical protein
MVDSISPHREAGAAVPLPQTLRPLFWDHDFDVLNWSEDRDLMVLRVLTAGNWEAVSWLRSQMGDHELKEWIASRCGRGLSPQRLRFWELVLGLPHRLVNAWLAAEKRHVWHDRLHR